MPVLVNLRDLEKQPSQLTGELHPEELDMNSSQDSVVKASGVLSYDLEIEQVEGGLLARGSLSLPLACECVRCLTSFAYDLVLPDWACLLPSEEEEKLVVVNDCVDLTPYIREDILLELPQHPLCNTDCSGLPGASSGKPGETRTNSGAQSGQSSSAWAELNKLKL